MVTQSSTPGASNATWLGLRLVCLCSDDWLALRILSKHYFTTLVLLTCFTFFFLMTSHILLFLPPLKNLVIINQTLTIHSTKCFRFKVNDSVNTNWTHTYTVQDRWEEFKRKHQQLVDCGNSWSDTVIEFNLEQFMSTYFSHDNLLSAQRQFFYNQEGSTAN